MIKFSKMSVFKKLFILFAFVTLTLGGSLLECSECNTAGLVRLYCICYEFCFLNQKTETSENGNKGTAMTEKDEDFSEDFNWDSDEVLSEEVKNYSAKSEDEQIAQKLFDDIDVMKAQVNDDDYVDDKYEANNDQINSKDVSDSENDFNNQDGDKANDDRNLSDDEINHIPFDKAEQNSKYDGEYNQNNDVDNSENFNSNDNINSEDNDEDFRNIIDDSVENDDSNPLDEFKENISHSDVGEDAFDEDDIDAEEYVKTWRELYEEDQKLLDKIYNSNENDKTEQRDDYNDEQENDNNLENNESIQKFVEKNTLMAPVIDTGRNIPSSDNTKELLEDSAIGEDSSDASEDDSQERKVNDDEPEGSVKNPHIAQIFELGDRIPGLDYNIETTQNPTNVEDIPKPTQNKVNDINIVTQKVESVDSTSNNDPTVLGGGNFPEKDVDKLKDLSDEPKHVVIDDQCDWESNDENLSTINKNVDESDSDETEVRIIELKVNESTVITSPNYPQPYGGQSVTDYLLVGTEGHGVEFNITDLALKLDANNYLLVKPGGLNEFAHSPIAFTGKLNQPRRCHFFDLDTLFVRFVSNAPVGGYSEYYGFNISVRSLYYKSNKSSTEDSTASPITGELRETYAVYVGGRNYSQFPLAEFRTILVDMAKDYVRQEDLEIGDIDINDIVQIPRVSSCMINWPSSDNCVAVTFGIPISSEDSNSPYQLNEYQLDEMWLRYSNKEDYKLRLESMGLYTFIVPNDAAVMTLWLLISAGIFFSVVLLAMTLWRWNCFQDYKGMRRLSETDSVSSVRKSSSLFPTPHQNLPPIYTETYWSDSEAPPKYSDSGDEGVKNKGFANDELFNLYSDDEIVMSLPDDKDKTRSSPVSRHDIYPV